MLVLSRRIGEKFFIADDICLTVISIDRSMVRLGIEAPPDVRADREETYRRLMEFQEPELLVVERN
jgi:carbon storage regulator